MKNIVLVGFMGTGKTVVAKKLARMLKMRYREVDSVIEQRQGMKINDIFKIKGEAFFRDAESRVIKELADQKGLVISAGGGAVLRRENVQDLERNGVLICLTASAKVIYQRIREETHRPLLKVANPRAEIKRLMETRRPLYGKIKKQINTDDKNVDQVVEEIKRMVYEEDQSCA